MHVIQVTCYGDHTPMCAVPWLQRLVPRLQQAPPCRLTVPALAATGGCGGGQQSWQSTARLLRMAGCAGAAAYAGAVAKRPPCSRPLSRSCVHVLCGCLEGGQRKGAG